MSAVATSESTDSCRVSFQKRQIVFLEADEAAYSEGLTRAFPGTRFWDYIPWKVRSNRERPPETTLLRSLTECRGMHVDILFDPEWNPRWVWNEHHSEWEDNSPKQRVISGVIERHGKPRDKDGRSILYEGDIYYRFDRDNKEETAIARKAIRLIDKVASNRDLMAVDIKTFDIIHPRCTGMPWVGHHARRWCLAEPNRLFEHPGLPMITIGYRPRPE